MFQTVGEIYKYRALVAALVLRHLSMRYRGSVLGFLWSFLNPLCLMLVYVLVFRYYIRFEGVENYTLFLFCGLLPWIWLSSGLLEGTSSIAAGGQLITKSMFPAHLLPVVSVITTMIHFVLSLPILLIFMLAAEVPFHLTLLLVPFLIVLQFLFLSGLAVGLGSLNVYFRDVQHILGNLLTFLFFLCPIVYPSSVVPESLKFTVEYNPLALLTLSYQQLILEGTLPSLATIAYLLGFVAVAVSLGHVLYSRYHEGFAELL